MAKLGTKIYCTSCGAIFKMDETDSVAGMPCSCTDTYPLLNWIVLKVNQPNSRFCLIGQI